MGDLPALVLICFSSSPVVAVLKLWQILFPWTGAAVYPFLSILVGKQKLSCKLPFPPTQYDIQLFHILGGMFPFFNNNPFISFISLIFLFSLKIHAFLMWRLVLDRMRMEVSILAPLLSVYLFYPLYIRTIVEMLFGHLKGLVYIMIILIYH